MRWFTTFPSWLYHESQELGNNSNYKEDHQFAGRTLISSGCVLVHKENTQRFPILIVYPDATPYIPPTVFLLKDRLDADTARSLSATPPSGIASRIRDRVQLLNRRHQNADGSICFLERGDVLESEPERFKIREILTRIRAWLAGHVPVDSVEAELFAHFGNRCPEIQYLLPDIFFDPELVKGEFYAGLVAVIRWNKAADSQKTYVGVYIVGANASGVSLPPKIYTRKELTLFTRLPDVGKLIAGTGRDLEKGVEDRTIIKGYWWDILSEPEPFSEVGDLASLIGGGDEASGYTELIGALGDLLGTLPDHIYLGIRFPGRKQGKEWLMLRLVRGKRPPLIIGKSDTPDKIRSELQARLCDYSLQALAVENFTEVYYHMRNAGRAKRETLREHAVSILGCGALGSEVADCLAKAGVGIMLLVDKEDFHAHNAVRHTLGIDSVGLPKVLGLAGYLVLRNPFVQLKLPEKVVDVLTAEIDEYLPQPFIGVSTIADDNVEAYLNHQGIANGRTIFYCRALRGGKVARIFRVIPKKDACFTCLSLYQRDGNRIVANIPADPALPAITNECNDPIRPASAADLKLVASVASRIFIDFLQGSAVKDNHWVFSMEPSPIRHGGTQIPPQKLTASFIPPHPNCPICRDISLKNVRVSRQAYDVMKTESATSGEIETGGLLIGHLSDDGDYIVSRATGPGPNAKRSPHGFERDDGHCQRELELAAKELGEKGLYLGEWHYHPIENNAPSSRDIKSLTEIARQDNYKISLPLMVILSKSLECALTIHEPTGTYHSIQFQIVDG